MIRPIPGLRMAPKPARRAPRDPRIPEGMLQDPGDSPLEFLTRNGLIVTLYRGLVVARKRRQDHAGQVWGGATAREVAEKLGWVP